MEMLDNRHLWMDTKYTIAGYQACREERLKNNPVSECVYGSWEIFGVKRRRKKKNIPHVSMYVENEDCRAIYTSKEDAS